MILNRAITNTKASYSVRRNKKRGSELSYARDTNPRGLDGDCLIKRRKEALSSTRIATFRNGIRRHVLPHLVRRESRGERKLSLNQPTRGENHSRWWQNLNHVISTGSSVIRVYRVVRFPLFDDDLTLSKTREPLFSSFQFPIASYSLGLSWKMIEIILGLNENNNNAFPTNLCYK